MNSAKHLATVALVFFLACSRSGAETPPVRSVAATMQHHEVRADRLPRPFVTESAGNPPRVVGRPRDAKLNLPPGFKIAVWAEGFQDPRNMIQASNGDVLLADTSNMEIVVLRDTNGDGLPDKRSTFYDGLDRPFGLAIRGPHLYVGNTSGVVRFDYKPGQLVSSGEPVNITKLPVGGHSTRNVVFNRAGTKMYVAVGSDSNVEDETWDPLRAAITEYNPDGTGKRTFASGLRNPIGLAWNPAKPNELWTCVNERDGLGDDLVPDYATDVKDGAFYGWPFSYIGKNREPRRANAPHLDLVAKAIPPTVLLEAHSAPITLNFYTGTMFPAQYRNGIFVAMHGSWNRSQRSGYKVVHIPFRNGQPTGGYDDFVTGWSPDPNARTVWGRPAGILPLRDGSLLITDDGAGVIWRVTYAP